MQVSAHTHTHTQQEVCSYIWGSPNLNKFQVLCLPTRNQDYWMFIYSTQLSHRWLNLNGWHEMSCHTLQIFSNCIVITFHPCFTTSWFHYFLIGIYICHLSLTIITRVEIIIIICASMAVNKNHFPLICLTPGHCLPHSLENINNNMVSLIFYLHGYNTLVHLNKLWIITWIRNP